MINCNLSEEQKQALFELFDSGLKSKDVARITGINYEIVEAIRNGKYLKMKLGKLKEIYI